MYCYLISLKDDDLEDMPPPDADASFVGETFEEAYTFIEGATWIVGTDIETCSEVLEALGIGMDGERSSYSCVVVRFSEYNGFVERGLWEKVAAWEKR